MIHEARAFRLIEAVAGEEGPHDCLWTLETGRYGSTIWVAFRLEGQTPVEAMIREKGWCISWQKWTKSTMSQEIEDDGEAAQLVIDFLKNEEWIEKR